MEEYNNDYTKQDDIDVDKYMAWHYDNKVKEVTHIFCTDRRGVVIINEDREEDNIEFTDELVLPKWIKESVKKIEKARLDKTDKPFRVTIKTNGCNHCCVSQGIATLALIGKFKHFINVFDVWYPDYVRVYPLMYAPIECVKITSL